VRGARDLGKTITVEGEVVKVHEGRFAVDDGQHESLVALFDPPLGPAAQRGQRVRAVISPHLHHLSSLTVLSAAPVDPLTQVAATPSLSLPGFGSIIPAVAPVAMPSIDALRQATGLDLNPGGAASDDEVPPEFGAYLAMQRFEDSLGNHLTLAFLPDLSAAGPMAGLIAKMVTRTGEAVPGLGTSASWSRDRMLAVTAGEKMFVIDTDFHAMVPPQRLAAARNVAQLVLDAMKTGSHVESN
jgi:hypothetical protein